MQSSIPNFFLSISSNSSRSWRLKSRNWSLHSGLNKNLNMFYEFFKPRTSSSVQVRWTAFSKTSPTLNRWKQSFEFIMIDVSSSIWVNNVHVIFGTADPSMEIVLPQTSNSLSLGLEAQDGNLEKCLALHYASIQKKRSADMNPQIWIRRDESLWQSNRLLVDSFRGET